jgi:hypothetical protein
MLSLGGMFQGPPPQSRHPMEGKTSNAKRANATTITIAVSSKIFLGFIYSIMRKQSLYLFRGLGF